MRDWTTYPDLTVRDLGMSHVNKSVYQRNEGSKLLSATVSITLLDNWSLVVLFPLVPLWHVNTGETENTRHHIQPVPFSQRVRQRLIYADTTFPKSAPTHVIGFIRGATFWSWDQNVAWGPKHSWKVCGIFFFPLFDCLSLFAHTPVYPSGVQKCLLFVRYPSGKDFLLVWGATLDVCHCLLASCNTPLCLAKLLLKPVGSKHLFHDQKPSVLFCVPLLMWNATQIW